MLLASYFSYPTKVTPRKFIGSNFIDLKIVWFIIHYYFGVSVCQEPPTS